MSLINFFQKKSPEETARLLAWQKVLMVNGPEKLILSEKRMRQMTDMMVAEDLRFLRMSLEILPGMRTKEERAERKAQMKKRIAHLEILKQYSDKVDAGVISRAARVL